MNTIKNNKRIIYTVGVLIIIITIIYVFKLSLNHSNNIELNAISIDDGWGYEILIDNKKIISQTCIPAVEGKQVFKSKKEAMKVGNVVVEKIKKKQPPVITKAELKKLDIHCDY